MVRRFQKQIVTHQLSLTASILISVLLWSVGYIIRPVAGLLETIGAYAMYALIGYLLVVLNKSFAIIRLRATFQTVIFMILIGVSPKIHAIYEGNIVALCFLASLFLYFSSFQLERTSGLLFHAFMIWGVACLLVPILVWLIPLIWYACFKFRGLNIKSFIASIFGWSIPIGAYATYMFLTNQWDSFLVLAAKPITLGNTILESIQPSSIVTLGCLFVVFLISATHTLSNALDEKVQARYYLFHIINITLATFVLMFLFPFEVRQLLPIVLVCLCILYGHYATLTDSKWSNIIFILVLLCSIPVFLIHLLY
ncbi:MAG: hypothetical protein IKP48_04385 [Bacteroidaceae bacterium]|nr:hypothetical protein [Bacteroidaceae bacterium]